MRILLTGAGGMVGRNLLDHHAIADFELLTPRRSDLDLTDYAATLRYLEARQPDLVIHAAGTVGGIQANIREPVRFLVENLDMGRNIVLAARAAGVPRLLNLGSSCMFPRNAPNPLVEEAVLQGELEPTNEGYALAKVTVARLCDYVGRENPALSYKTLIPCNLYGRHDKFSPGVSHLVPAIIHKVHEAKLAGDDSVEIWGDGTARREFLYAGDLADCLVEAIGRFDSLPALMNVGLGHDYSINDYYRMIAEVIGYRGGFHHDLSRPVGMAQKLVDTRRAEAWGWRARTSLADGAARTYDYYLRQRAEQGW
ncbi:GDP-L-fucose synthase family protein [Chitinimonas lacunae]|uniref:GDP-L-fucose synthase n=1 Tax=Chitinimonas lacunae TaxID=1963018 RepID=A0ABV8MYB9_9NEIS